MDTKAVIKELGIDVSVLNDLTKEVESYFYDIPYDAAKILMTKMWAVKSTLSEWVTRAKRLVMSRKREMEVALVVAKTSSEEKSEAAKEREAKNDKKYQTACELFDAATLVHEFLVMKRNDVTEGHFMCKDLRREGSETRVSEPRDSGSF
jgi:hypothetical protein